MVRIVPAPWFKYLLAFWFIIFVPSGSIAILNGLYFHYNSTSPTQDILFGVLLFLFPFAFAIYFLTFGRARKLEISADGINFGRKYYGPFNRKGPFDVWHGLKTHEQELFIPWGEVDSIHLGIWSRWWARYSSVFTSYLGDKRTTKKEAFLTGLGIPVKRVEVYFLTIETTKGDYYSFDLSFNLTQNAKKAIFESGKQNLIHEEMYSV
jgi:hypothetical protein